MRFTNSKVLSCLVFSCLYAGSALATDTRVGVLRYNGGIDDETLVFTYPGQISKYNVALFELGTYDDKNAYGAAFANTGSFHIGAALSRTDWLFTNGALSYNANSGNISTVSLLDKYETDMLKATDPELSVPARPIELLAGFDIGAGTLGLRLSMASYRNKESADAAGVATNVEKTAQQTELALGFHTGAAGSLDVALTMAPTLAQKHTNTSGGTDSSTSLKGSSTSIDFRWLSTENASSPYAKAKLSTRAMKASGKSTGRDFSSKFSDQINSIEGGYVAMTDAKGPKLFVGAELMTSESKGPTTAVTTASGTTTVAPSYNSSDESAKISANVISGTLSGEMDAAWGLGLMAGMHYVMFGDITTKDNTEAKNIKNVTIFPETTDAYLWALGLYYKAEALRIDAKYEKKLLHNGPFFLSGDATGPAMFTKISASYMF